MSRNTAGTFSLPAGNPVVSGTTITSTNENAFRADVATELSNSLDRSGRGAMLAPLQLQDGSSSAPSLTFGTEATTGLYRAGAGDLRLLAAGTEALKLTTSGVTTALAATTGALTVNGNATVAGNVPMTGSTPASTTGFSNTLTKANTPKAWGYISVAAGVPTVTEGFNVASVGYNGTALRVTLATAMANANYACVPHTFASQTARILALNASYFDIRLSDFGTGVDIDTRSGTWTVWFTLFGRQ